MDGPPVKKIKTEVDEKLVKTQNKVMFKFRDNLSSLTKNELSDLVEHNVNDFDGDCPSSEVGTTDEATIISHIILLLIFLTYPKKHPSILEFFHPLNSNTCMNIT